MDVSNTALKAGILMPLAVSAAVWEKYIRVPDYLGDIEERLTEENRLWDLLAMFRLAASKDPTSDWLEFETLVKTQPGPSRCVELKAITSPSGTAIPVITIMLPDEEFRQHPDKTNGANAKAN